MNNIKTSGEQMSTRKSRAFVSTSTSSCSLNKAASMVNGPPVALVTPPLDSLNATILNSSSFLLLMLFALLLLLLPFSLSSLLLLEPPELPKLVLASPSISSASPNFPSLESLPSLAKHSVATHNLSFFLLCLCFATARDKSTFATISPVHKMKS